MTEKKNNISEFDKDYLILALRLKHLNERYIDADYGPPEIKLKVENEKKYSLRNLLKYCSEILKKNYLSKVMTNPKRKT